MVVKDKTLKSVGLRWLIIYRESSPLGQLANQLDRNILFTVNLTPRVRVSKQPPSSKCRPSYHTMSVIMSVMSTPINHLKQRQSQ